MIGKIITLIYSMLAVTTMILAGIKIAGMSPAMTWWNVVTPLMVGLGIIFTVMMVLIACSVSAARRDAAEIDKSLDRIEKLVDDRIEREGEWE